MDSRESKLLAPPQSQSQMHSQPVMMIGPPNMYSHGLFNGGGSGTSSPAVMSSSMMQNPSFSLSPPGQQSAPAVVESLNSPLVGKPTSQEGPPGFSGDTGKKKRGRPRKYPLDGNIGLGLASDSGACSPSASPLPSSGRATNHENSGTDPPTKKNKGRPPNSGKKQMDALGSSGFAFTPHILLVEAGEDITSKVNAFSMEGPRNVCIISANGSICNVTLLQPALSDRAVTYEGRFQILSLTGAFSPPESDGSLNGSTTIFVSLAGSDGQVLGGGVMGKLIAATQVQVFIGSFIAEGTKKQSKPGMISPTTSKPVAAESPASEGPTTVSSHENGGSPSAGPFGNVAPQHHQGHNMSVYSSMGWGNSAMKM